MKESQFETAFNIYKTSFEIGRGGSGVVYEVSDEDLNVYALKLLEPDKITNEKRKRFKNEIHYCSKVSHPNIISVIDWGFCAANGVKHPFYVMPRYPMTLRDLIKKGIGFDKVLSYFLQLLSGLEMAHREGIWHRDLKPENILFAQDANQMVIADFGIAHFNKENLLTTVETNPNAKMANLQYAAPEQRKKGAKVDFRADIFSLGLILNEMFTGEVIHGTGYKKIKDVAPGHDFLDELVELMIMQSPDARPLISEINLKLNGNIDSLMSERADEEEDIVTPYLDRNRILTEQKLFVDFRKEWFDSEQSVEDAAKSVSEVFSLLLEIYESGKDVFSVKDIRFRRNDTMCGIYHADIGCHVTVPNLRRGNTLKSTKPELFLEIVLFNSGGFHNYVGNHLKEIFLYPEINKQRQLVWIDRLNDSTAWPEEKIAKRCFKLFISEIQKIPEDPKKSEEIKEDEKEFWEDLRKMTTGTQ